MGSIRYPVEEIRERCDLVEIISNYVSLRKAGRRLLGLCPFHSEKTPSFHVDPERQWWKCFGCGEGGDVFDFVRKIDNLTFPEAVEMLAQKAGVHIERPEKIARELSERERLLKANNAACAFFAELLKDSKKAQAYLDKRGLTESSITKYKLGYAPSNWDDLVQHLKKCNVAPADAVKAGLTIPRENSPGFYDRFRDRLMFPIMDSSERIIGFGGRALEDSDVKYLNSPETPLFLKNKTLYGLNFAKRAVSQQDKLLVVEGYMDVIAAQEAEFENTVATLGTALSEEHVNVIARFTHNVVLSFDADSAGMKAALRSAPIFERAGFNIRILSMPKGEDPDSMLRNGDRTRFATLIEKALPVPDFKIKLVLMQHDMKSDSGKTDALREAAAILAEVESVVERERLIRLLVRYHPNFSSGTTLAESHLRSEVNSLRSRVVRQQDRRGFDPVMNRENLAQKAKKQISSVERSEQLLLGMIIVRDIDPGKVFAALPPNSFIGESTKTLAEVLSKQYTELGKIDQGRVRDDIAGTPAESLFTDLLVGMDDSEFNHPVEEVIRNILDHKKNEWRNRYRALAQKIQEGLITKGDEEYEEYWRLAREMKGNTAPRVIRRSMTDDKSK